MEFDTLAKKRASIRKFSSKKPPIEKITEAIVTANLAPSPGNLGMINYVIIEKPETIDKIADACQQPFIKQAPFIVVICSDNKQVERNYEERAKMYSRQHAGAVIQNFLLKITELNLASCWVGAFSDETIHNLLNIPDQINIEAILPIGFQPVYNHTKQKTKSSLDNRVYFETYGNKHKVPYRRIGNH